MVVDHWRVCFGLLRRIAWNQKGTSGVIPAKKAMMSGQKRATPLPF